MKQESDLLVVKPPSYLYLLLNNLDDIILICKFQDSINDKSYEVTPKKKHLEILLDITGSPLKVDLDNSSLLSLELQDDCNNFWLKPEETHTPISYEEACKFVEDFWFKNYSTIKLLPIWCVCDGKDKKKTILLSAKQTPTYISRSSVTCRGYFPKSHNSIVFESLCNTHFESVRQLTGNKQKIPLRQLTTEISSTYELFGYKITQSNFNNINIQGSVYLEVKWNLCCADIPLDHSKSIMVTTNTSKMYFLIVLTNTIQSIVGQQSSVLYRFWKELILLELYIKALAEYNAKEMSNNYWLPSNAGVSDNSNLIEQIIEIVNNSFYVPRYVSDVEGKKILKIIEKVDSRHTYDITDRLWVVLNKCSKYGDLNDCLNVVFTEIAQTDNKVYIAETNMTIMAQMIRDIVARKLPMFVLTGTQSIEILIDIGLEKLKKDFIHIFSEFGVVSEQELNLSFSQLFKTMFANSENNSNNENSNLMDLFRNNIRSSLYHKKSIINNYYIEERIKMLGQLHAALETLILVPMQWQPASEKYIYEHFVKNNSVFDSFATLARNKLYEIQIELAVSDIYEFIKKLNPVMWRFSLIFSRPIYSVQSIFHLSQRPIFPPSIYQHDVLECPVIDPNEVYYHFTQLTQLTSFINTQLA